MLRERMLTKKLYEAQFKREDSWYKELSYATAAGIGLGLIGASIAELVPSEFGAEATIRGSIGSSDGVSEGSLALYRRYVRKRELGGTGWYAIGKISGAGLGVISDYISRNFIDVYSKAASYVPAIYSQGDQLLGPLFLFVYNFLQNSGNIPQRMGRSFKDPVLLTSLGVFSLSVGIVTLMRHFNVPDSRLEYFIENLVLQPLCIAPPLVGRWVEKKTKT